MKAFKQLNEVRATIEEHRLMLLLMKTEHCGVCEAIQAKVESLVEEMPRAHSGYVYVEDVPELASEYLVLTAPVLLLFFEGREVHRFSRFVRLDELHSVLERYIQWMDADTDIPHPEHVVADGIFGGQQPDKRI
ncbi:thioredoxin family protein [Paenibacillus sp. J5C_2022]|uniref:thioredoxin family protein n=1 Tax=Paenibacillus sp. J5C2022 TaxID=2977129 RepID=UPI0021CE8CB8|nr:thioredoxin family protein [Paenibacillus sp. J5C2022]MCU6709118.1 thioredoxin family protein [Paenibacillus sp. J5C2022]